MYDDFLTLSGHLRSASGRGRAMAFSAILLSSVAAGPVHAEGLMEALTAAYQTSPVLDAQRDPLALQRVLGEYLSEPKNHVQFEGSESVVTQGAVTLDRRTRMVYDAQHVFINGESFLASGRDALVIRQLADDRRLDAAAVKRLSAAARSLVQDWLEAGWLHVGH